MAAPILTPNESAPSRGKAQGAWCFDLTTNPLTKEQMNVSYHDDNALV